MKHLFLLAFFVPSFAWAQTYATRFVQSTPTIEAAAYATGDTVGSLNTFTAICQSRTGRGQILGVKIFDKAKQGIDLDLVLFNTTPSGTFTDNAAFDPNDSALPNIVAEISITTHEAFNDNGVSLASNILVPVACDSSNTLYGYLVSRGAPTYASTTDLTIQVELAPDIQ